MAKLGVKPVNQVRFIWFSGEEQGLFGSTYYADQLTKTQRGNAVAMLDFDMLASPNYALLIYDGDGSEFPVVRPERFRHRGERLPEVLRRARPYTERIPFDGRSDYDEFTEVGIPAGGVAAGAEVHKTAAQAVPLGRHRVRLARGPVRPVLPPDCDSYDRRVPGQHQQHGAEHHLQRRRALRADVRDDDLLGERHRQGQRNATKSDYEWKGDHRAARAPSSPGRAPRAGARPSARPARRRRAGARRAGRAPRRARRRP